MRGGKSPHISRASLTSEWWLPAWLWYDEKMRVRGGEFDKEGYVGNG